MNESTNPRFKGIERLYGREAQIKIEKSHVCIMGIGGVGSWAAESLARTGVGKLTLVDMDEVCLSNVNRQLHALDGNVGQSKVQVIKKRILKINPECEVECIEKFFTRETAEEILSTEYDYIIDAFDSMWNKAFLISECVKRNKKICTVGGAGGKSDPTKIETSDLNFTLRDPFCFLLRKNLKREYGFSRDKSVAFGVDCVFSTEDVSYLKENGEIGMTKTREQRLKLDCSTGLGSAAHLTGSFGFAAAHSAIMSIIKS